jgi:hypothetical protein
MSNQTITTAERWIDLSANTNEATRNSVLKVILLSEQGNNYGTDRSALDSSIRIPVNNARSNLNLLANAQYS